MRAMNRLCAAGPSQASPTCATLLPTRIPFCVILFVVGLAILNVFQWCKILTSEGPTLALGEVSNCSTMGQRLTEPRVELVANLSRNRNAHIFIVPESLRNTEGQSPLVCVPQKNGNRQFGGLLYAIWNDKPPPSAEAVVEDMKRWEIKKLPSSMNNSHVYFVARNPYTRALSLYLQKVVNDCVSASKYGCQSGYLGMSSETSFKAFVDSVEQKVARAGSLCAVDHHLCQQVESCLTTTHVAQEVTIVRLEEQSSWFPCFVQQTGMNSTLLDNGWANFTGQSCYYSATGDCKDMLRSIEPNKVEVMTGDVHATGASKVDRLRVHYDAKTAETISRLYADDFRILGYPLWDDQHLSK